MSETKREEALAHFGVKGMKWGVRNLQERGAAKRDARIESFKTVNQAIASGTHKNQKSAELATLLNASPLELAKHKGSAKKIAAGRAFSAELMQKKIESGTAKRADRQGRTKPGRRLSKSGMLV